MNLYQFHNDNINDVSLKNNSDYINGLFRFVSCLETSQSKWQYI